MTSYCKFGCQTILDLLDGFRKNIDGVIENEDMECVHKTRVTSRKLRAALPLFKLCFPSQRIQEMEQANKKSHSLLGEARDLDVQIAFVEKYMKKLAQQRKNASKYCLMTAADERDSIQPAVVKWIREAKGIRHPAGDGKLSANTPFLSSLNPVFDTKQVLEKAQWHISFRLDDFLSLKKYVYMENETPKHHEMRINAKKLRYTMEFFAPLIQEQT